MKDKNTQMIIKIFSFVICLGAITNLNAEVRYIDDTLKIPLRSGASTEHRIVRFLNSGRKVEMQYLDEDDKQWAFVSLEGGQEGWVQIRYLKNTPAAKQLLALSQKELATTKKKTKEQKSKINELKVEIKNLKDNQKSLSKHSSSADKELIHIKEISKNAIRLDHSNSKLLEENEILKANHEESTLQITKLESNQKKEGMIYGMVAVVLGIIMGLIFPRLKSTRSQDGWV